MDGVHTRSVDRALDLIEGVEARFGGTPVELNAPVGAETLHRFEFDAVVSDVVGRGIGPTRTGQPVA